jgi:formamidopyrimidine-DNA glycosylase
VSGKTLERIEAHGKNLFYFFGGSQLADPGVVVVHIHFGMAGQFRIARLPGRDPTKTTRLQLINSDEGIVAQLSAMTLVHGDYSLYTSKLAKLGQDPLRDDADVEAIWAMLQKKKATVPIGEFLMDQRAIAGVGNIYRAEILFKAGVHPEQPCKHVSRAAFDRIWHHCVDCMRRGFIGGSIITVDPEEALVLGAPWTRRYVYNQARCGRCKSRVRTWDMKARKVYACETCQPLCGQHMPIGEGEEVIVIDDTDLLDQKKGGFELAPLRRKALSEAVDSVPFVSHCARDDAHTLAIKREQSGIKREQSGIKREQSGPASASSAIPSLGRMKVADLKEALKAAGLAVNGLKAELKQRLVHHLESSAAPAMPSAAPSAAPTTPVPMAPMAMASAAEAAREKMQAGENRAIEHVALVDEDSEAVIHAKRPHHKRKLATESKAKPKHRKCIVEAMDVAAWFKTES